MSPLMEVVVRNCPGSFGLVEGCANGFFVLGDSSHASEAFQRYPLHVKTNEMLTYDGFSDDRFFRAPFALLDAHPDSSYRRFLLGLEDSHFSSMNPVVGRQGRDGGRVWTRYWSVSSTYDVYTIGTDELNGCAYGFNALSSPSGRVRIGLAISPADTTGR